MSKGSFIIKKETWPVFVFTCSDVELFDDLEMLGVWTFFLNWYHFNEGTELDTAEHALSALKDRFKLSDEKGKEICQYLGSKGLVKYTP